MRFMWPRPPPVASPDDLPPVTMYGAEHRCDIYSCPCCRRWVRLYDAHHRLLLRYEDALAELRQASLPPPLRPNPVPLNTVTQANKAEVAETFGPERFGDT